MAFIEPMHRNKPNITYLLPQVEIPEKLTQEPPCFAITTGVRLRSHTKKTGCQCALYTSAVIFLILMRTV